MRAKRRVNPRMQRSFTLLELIVVIVILGILATLGFTQYSKVVEYHRLAEAKAQISLMRQLAHEYYLKNGSMDNVQLDDVGAYFACTSNNFFKYWAGSGDGGSWVHLVAVRCTSGGKSPNTTREYEYYMRYYPASGQNEWHCVYYDDRSGCFGLTP